MIDARGTGAPKPGTVCERAGVAGKPWLFEY